MSDRKKIWLVSELFYPETISTGYIMTEIAKHLRENYQVSVVSGPEFYEVKKDNKKKKILSDVVIHRVKHKGYNKNNFISRVIGHLKITYGMLRLMKNKIPNNSDVLLVTNPVLLVVFVGFLVKKRNWKIKLLVHDAFPENLVISGFLKSKKSLLFSPLAYIFNNSFKKMDELIVLGRDMQELFKQKVGSDKKIRVIENWADTENIVPHSIVRNKIKNFLFAGNMGRLQGIEVLLDSLKNTKSQPYTFTFIGNGALDSYIENYIKVNKLTQVQKYNWIEREKQNSFMADAMIGVVTLKKNMYGLGVPSKFYNLLAAGKPIFYIGDINSELHLVLQEYKIGWFAESGNVKMIVKVLEEIVRTSHLEVEEYSKRARALAEAKYSKEFILHKFNSLFKRNNC